MQKTTENDTVPTPGLVWRCHFTSLKVKEEDLAHEVFTIAVANLANISGTRKIKMAHEKTEWKGKLLLPVTLHNTTPSMFCVNVSRAILELACRQHAGSLVPAGEAHMGSLVPEGTTWGIPDLSKKVKYPNIHINYIILIIGNTRGDPMSQIKEPNLNMSIKTADGKFKNKLSNMRERF